MAVTKLEDLDLSRQYTYADYVTWRFQERVELLRGWVAKMSPAPNRRHQTIVSNFFRIVSDHFHRSGCRVYTAPFDVRLPRTGGGESVVQPDLCAICEESKLTEQGCTGAPDWVIEILSPGNSKREMRDKFALYEESGVREYWIVDPTHVSVQTYLLENEKFVVGPLYYEDDEAEFGPSIFPTLKISGTDLFEG